MRLVFFIVVFGMIFGCKNTLAERKIISPTKGDVWIEGKAYKIMWKDFHKGFLCISVLVGGKDMGIINSCNTPAYKGVYVWKIPIGFVSNFGVDKDDEVRVVLFYKNDENHPVFSDYFTISK